MQASEIVGVNADGLTTKVREKIGSIQLTVKANAAVGSTIVKVSNITGANGVLGDPLVIGTTSTATINITSDAGNNNNTTEGNNTTNIITNNTTNKNTASNTIPKAGTTAEYMIAGIVIVSVCAATSYIIYKKKYNF